MSVFVAPDCALIVQLLGADCAALAPRELYCDCAAIV